MSSHCCPGLQQRVLLRGVGLQECSALGIAGGDVTPELLALRAELPGLVRAAAEKLRDPEVATAASYYQVCSWA